MKSRLLPIENAYPAEIATKFNEPDRLHGTPVELIYPGSGWDFTSFWNIANPTRAFLFDPAPAVNFASPLDGLQTWKGQLISQLELLRTHDIIQFVYDVGKGHAYRVTDEELAGFTNADCSEDGTTRVAISARVTVSGLERIVTSVAARFHEVATLRRVSVAGDIRDCATLRDSWPIVYEHKSMVSRDAMEQAIAPGGCLIWGLPDTAPKVQWLEI